jgi:hypothetical protein
MTLPRNIVRNAGLLVLIVALLVAIALVSA